MSTEQEQEKDSVSEASVEERSVAELTAGGDPAPAAKQEDGPDLGAEALTAAETAISEGESTLRDLTDPTPDAAAKTGGARRWMPRDRQRVLQAMLIFNLILMAVMLALPGAKTPEPDDASANPGEVSPPDPLPPVAESGPAPSGSRPTEQGRVPNKDLWIRALVFFGEGKYDEAAESLLEYDRLNPRILEGQKLDLYTMLSSCLFKAGRMEDAARYRAKTRILVDRGYLPEDLRNAARKAWEDGRSEEARRYFARFLLQKKQIPAELHDSVAEAFLRIGDSYRMSADIGAGNRGYWSGNVELDPGKEQGEKR